MAHAAPIASIAGITLAMNPTMPNIISRPHYSPPGSACQEMEQAPPWWTAGQTLPAFARAASHEPRGRKPS
jgi:hypothetical protein